MEAQSKQTSALLSKLGGLRVASPARGSARSTVPYDEIVANLDSPLPHWDRVKEGVLSNGMRYYIQPNTVRPSMSYSGADTHTDNDAIKSSVDSAQYI
jgi:hypothetical protein